jgi:isopentenyl diphosphate isomerase/L-lactate dehydrogenase-like FMN-dependent dehydrogenase
MPYQLSRVFNHWDMRDLARRRLPRAIFDYVDYGSEEGVAVRDNRAALERIKIRPRTVVDVSKRDQSITLFGKRRAMPVIIGPTGGAGLCWYEAEICLARAAAKAGIPMTIATAATVPMEKVAAEATSGYWQQLYLWNDRALSHQIVERANRAGAEALMLTVDTAVGSNREHNARNDFSNPFKMTPRIGFDIARHPRWVLATMARYMLNGGMPRFVNYPEGSQMRVTGAPIQQSLSPSINWNDVKELRAKWPRILMLKGIASPEDARRAADHGCDAIVVSNHGGRQLDAAEATIDVLPEIVDAVGDKITVLVDSGFRRGTDVVKALALGAKAVLVGRATLFGVAGAGEPGAHRALAMLRDEIDRTLALSGCTSFADVDRTLLRMPKS